MSAANAFSLDQSKILSCGKELNTGLFVTCVAYNETRIAASYTCIQTQKCVHISKFYYEKLIAIMDEQNILHVCILYKKEILRETSDHDSIYFIQIEKT